MGIRGVVCLTLWLGACAPTGAGEGAFCPPVGEGEPSICADGLFCSRTTSVCTAPSELGEACGDVCAVGLFCGLDDTCQLPGPEGSICQRNVACEDGLLCNHGYQPEEPWLGECRPLSDVGEPCSYSQYELDGQGSTGCLLSLTCVAPAVTWTTIVTHPTNSDCINRGADDPGCGFPGVCAALWSIPVGAPCLGGGACADAGYCNPIPVPWADQESEGFACLGNSDCWHGPWPGRCAIDQLAPTDREDCTTTACAPGFLCDHAGLCQPRFHGGLLARCNTYGTGVLDDDFCMIGRHCDADTGRCEIGFPL